MSSNPTARWMVYGANGYTGRLIAKEAKRRGLAPVIAGRNRAAIEALAHTLGFEWRAFACADAAEVARGLDGMSLVLHCAGPFSATSKPMMKACLQTKTHYLDITGEIPVFERFLSRPHVFRDAGIVAIPGVGFDVVPTDCVAAMLKERLPTARELTLAIHVTNGASPGSLKTITEGLYVGAVIRRQGKLERVSPTFGARDIDFSNGRRFSVLIPWGDLSTAFYSTGIGDIRTYYAVGRRGYRLIQATALVRPVLGLRFIQKAIHRQIERRVPGPSAELRQQSGYSVYGEVVDAAGSRERLWMDTPNGYDFTADAALSSVERVLRGDVECGAWTPSKAFGSGFAQTLKGVRVSQPPRE